MHWCLADVLDIYAGESGLRGRKDAWSDSETQVIYPDAQPGIPRPRPRPNGAVRPEKAPAPTKAPVRLDVPPPPGEGSNGQAVPQGSAATGRDGRPWVAPAAGMSGPYGPPSQVMPVRFDQRQDQDGLQVRGRADFQSAGQGRADYQSAQRLDGLQIRPTDPSPWMGNPAPPQDSRQLPVQDQDQPQPFTNPLRGDYQ
jgi:hypothetical protein